MSGCTLTIILRKTKWAMGNVGESADLCGCDENAAHTHASSSDKYIGVLCKATAKCKILVIILWGVVGQWNERSPHFLRLFPDKRHLHVRMFNHPFHTYCSIMFETSKLEPGWAKTLKYEWCWRIFVFFLNCTMLTWRSFSCTNAEFYEIGFWTEFFEVVLWTRNVSILCNSNYSPLNTRHSNFEHNQTNQNSSAKMRLVLWKGHPESQRKCVPSVSFEFNIGFTFANQNVLFFIALSITSIRKSLPQK